MLDTYTNTHSILQQQEILLKYNCTSLTSEETQLCFLRAAGSPQPNNTGPWALKFGNRFIFVSYQNGHRAAVSISPQWGGVKVTKQKYSHNKTPSELQTCH